MNQCSTHHPGPMTRAELSVFMNPRITLDQPYFSLVTGKNINLYTGEEIHLMKKCVAILEGYLRYRQQRKTAKGREIISKKKRIRKKYPVTKCRYCMDGNIAMTTPKTATLAKIALDTML